MAGAGFQLFGKASTLASSKLHSSSVYVRLRVVFTFVGLEAVDEGTEAVVTVFPVWDKVVPPGQTRAAWINLPRVSLRGCRG